MISPTKVFLYIICSHLLELALFFFCCFLLWIVSLSTGCQQCRWLLYKILGYDCCKILQWQSAAVHYWTAAHVNCIVNSLVPRPGLGTGLHGDGLPSSFPLICQGMTIAIAACREGCQSGTMSQYYCCRREHDCCGHWHCTVQSIIWDCGNCPKCTIRDHTP